MAKLQTALKRQGTLVVKRKSYLQRNVDLFGRETLLPASETLAARFARAGTPKPKSEILMVGEAPDGFGKQVIWHPDDTGLALIAFLNAGDYLGVMISGIKQSDTIEFVFAGGLASFAEETENEGIASIIGIVAAGANAAAAAFDAPEAKEVIDRAASYAQSQFQEKKVKTKRRDPFGEDPASGHKARQEGGVLVSLPEARRQYYSGDEDHQDRWIKKPGTRDNAHHPEHVKGAFFLQPNSQNKRTAGAAGDIIIYPWDFKFEDNFGFYRLHILLKRGNGRLPVIN